MDKVKKKRIKGHFNFFGKKYKTSETIVGWAFLMPALVLGFIFIVLPIIISLSYSFTDANLLKLDQIKWNSFKNFKDLFSDKLLRTAFMNTMEFVIKVVPLQLGVSLGLALILNSKIKFNTFFRWVFFCPVMLSLAVTSMLWMNLLNEQEGLINAVFEMIGLGRQQFLSDPKKAMDILVIISVWQGAGYQMLIFLSGLKNISNDMYEASSIDGANKFQQFTKITLPSIKPTFSFVLITMLIGAFKLITQPMIMTQGGPTDSTLTMSYYIYQQGVTYREVGYSSAIALVYTIVLAAITLSIRKFMEKE